MGALMCTIHHCMAFMDVRISPLQKTTRTMLRLRRSGRTASWGWFKTLNCRGVRRWASYGERTLTQWHAITWFQLRRRGKWWKIDENCAWILRTTTTLASLCSLGSPRPWEAFLKSRSGHDAFLRCQMSLRCAAAAGDFQCRLQWHFGGHRWGARLGDEIIQWIQWYLLIHTHTYRYTTYLYIFWNVIWRVLNMIYEELYCKLWYEECDKCCRIWRHTARARFRSPTRKAMGIMNIWWFWLNKSWMSLRDAFGHVMFWVTWSLKPLLQAACRSTKSSECSRMPRPIRQGTSVTSVAVVRAFFCAIFKTMWVMWVHLPLFAPFWSCDVRMKMIWPEVRWWPERLSGLSLTGSENIESKWVRVSSCESISTYFNSLIIGMNAWPLLRIQGYGFCVHFILKDFHQSTAMHVLSPMLAASSSSYAAWCWLFNRASPSQSTWEEQERLWKRLMQLHTQSCCRKATCRIITTLYISTSVWHAAEQSRHMKAFRDLMLVLSLDGPDIHCLRGENFEARPRTAREENGGGSRNTHVYVYI